MKNIKFTKMQASGNDFVVIEKEHSPVLGSRFSVLVKNICQLKKGVGADGVLLLEKSKEADVKMRIFNPDGREVSMCGNGARCTALYVSKRGAKIKIETKAGLLEAEVKGNNVRLKMSNPKDLKLDMVLRSGKNKIKGHFINTGVPHFVVFVKNIEKFDVKSVGADIRYNKYFSGGTNADFVRVGKKNITVRTYERGVEDETLACGTGSVASALISALVGNKPSPVNVMTRGGEVLRVYFKKAGLKFKDVYLEGKAYMVFEGSYPLN